MCSNRSSVAVTGFLGPRPASFSSACSFVSVASPCHYEKGGSVLAERAGICETTRTVRKAGCLLQGLPAALIAKLMYWEVMTLTSAGGHADSDDAMTCNAMVTSADEHLLGLPVELDVRLLARLADHLERVHAEAGHLAVVLRDASVCTAGIVGQFSSHQLMVGRANASSMPSS